MKTLIAVLVVGLVGCGGSVFQGKWSGDVKSAATCTDNSTATRTDPVTWDIESIASTLINIHPRGGTCGSFQADVVGAGNVATFEPQACPDFTVGTMTFKMNEIGGTLGVLDNGQLNVSMRLTMTTSTVSCTDDLTSTMRRLP